MSTRTPLRRRGKRDARSAPIEPSSWPWPSSTSARSSSKRPLQHGGFAEQRLRLGEEVRDRLDLVLRPEHELLRSLGHLQQQVHARVAREVLHEQRQIAHNASTRYPRIDLDRHFLTLRDGFE